MEKLRRGKINTTILTSTILTIFILSKVEGNNITKFFDYTQNDHIKDLPLMGGFFLNIF
jgi:hypothetical protein